MRDEQPRYGPPLKVEVIKVFDAPAAWLGYSRWTYADATVCRQTHMVKIVDGGYVITRSQVAPDENLSRCR